jgi:PAS domain-containing protein
MGKSVTSLVVMILVLCALCAGWTVFLSNLATEAERDAELLTLHSDLNDATIKTLATNASATDRGLQLSHKELKGAIGENTLAALLLGGVEKKRNSLLAAKPQNRKTQLQAFEKENSALTRALKNDVLADVRTLRDFAAVGAGLSATAVAAIIALLLRNQSSTQGRTRIVSASQEKLTELESTLLVHLRSVVFQIDDNLLIKKAGASTRDVLGYTSEELLAKPLTDLMRLPEEQIRTVLSTARNTRTEQSAECDFYSKSGQLLRMQWVVASKGRRGYVCLAVETS